jgi:hypothetical protein
MSNSRAAVEFHVEGFPFEINRLTQPFMNDFLDAATDAERETIKLNCLLALLKAQQLDSYPPHLALRAPLLDHVLQLPDDEKRGALKAILDPTLQAGQFFLVSSGFKPSSIKRHHGLLFKALQAYCQVATDADADFSFQVAQQLAQLVANKRKRPAIVLSALLTLLQKSLSSKEANNGQVQAVLNLLKWAHKNNIRELVLNAYSPAITKQFLDLLDSMMQHGLPSSDMLTLLETKMQTEYRHNASLVDLVSYHGNDELTQQFSKLLVSCNQSDADLPRIRGILNQRVLSIGYVFSTENRDAMLNRIYDVVNRSEKIDVIYRLWQSGILVEEKKKLVCGFGPGKVETNFKNARMQKLMVDFILNLTDPEEKVLALTLANSSELFPTERTRIEREFEAQRPREPQRRHAIRRPAAAPARVEAPQPSQPVVATVAPQPVFIAAPEPVAVAPAPQHYPTLHESAAPLPSHVAAPAQPIFPPMAYALEPQTDPYAGSSAPLMSFIQAPIAPEPMMLPDGPLISFLPQAAPAPVMMGNNPFLAPFPVNSNPVFITADSDLFQRLELLKPPGQPVFVTANRSSTADIMALFEKTAEPLQPLASPAPAPAPVVAAPVAAQSEDDVMAQLAALTPIDMMAQLAALAPINVEQPEQAEPERKRSPAKSLSE